MRVKATLTTSYTIELTDEEARVLRSVLRSIGGSPEGPRSVIANLDAAMAASGVVTMYSHLKGSTDLPNNWEGYDKDGN